MINQLIQVISQEALVFEEFLKLLERQKELLVTNNAQDLSKITELQRDKLLESQQLNRKREELFESIKAANAVDGDLTVTRILEFADETQGQRLLQLRELILGLNDKISESRNTNAILLNQSREFISRTMSMLSKMNEGESTYSAAGVSSQSQATVMIDRRI
ncbi:MAG: hypothetical protein DRP45_02675 [Candidatus Zixiibacteriota bacterium]|nr:MAG: hypothetical protein DRP45_02675 [candidate division Zixibacteria bacterium]